MGSIHSLIFYSALCDENVGKVLSLASPTSPATRGLSLMHRDNIGGGYRDGKTCFHVDIYTETANRKIHF